VIQVEFKDWKRFPWLPAVVLA